MPSWKKVIVSGSDASLNSLQVSSSITAAHFSGSFSGSFQGNGSLLTDIVSSSFAISASYASFATTASFALNSVSSIGWDLVTDKPEGLVSSSAQVNYPDISNIPVGILSSSTQVDYFQIPNVPAGILSSSTQIDYFQIPNIPAGILSSSAQVDYLQIFNIPSGILSSSSQIASDISGAFTSVSSSIALDVTGLDTRLDTLESKTLVSGSSQIILQDTTGDLSGSRIIGLVTSASYAITASNAILFDGFPSSHYAVTGSNSFSGSQTIYGNLNVTQQFTASGLNYPTVDGLFGVEVLQTDGAGNLTLEIPETLYEEVKNNDVVTLVKGTPVKVVGNAGNQSLVVRADAGNPALMPASYILADDLAPQAEGLGLILGKITGVNTAGFTAGEVVYVAVGGGYTQIRPTGSAQVQPLGFPVKIASNGGSGVIMNPGVANDLPNLTQGYMWVGGTGSVPTTIASSSFAKVGENNTFTGTQTFTNIVVNGTGSFSYIESVTGSAKIIGDAFIILNNNLPAESYGGIKVIDSGSTNITASLLWDGTTNHWVYENVSGSTYGAAGLIAGPRSTGLDSIIYPTQYKVLRSQGGDHIYDSNITDDDNLVSISIPLSVTGDITSSASIKSIGGFVGNLTGNASTATTASYVEYNDVANKPTLISSSIQVDYLGLSNIPANIVSSSLQIATEISGAFTSTSSSIAIDITSLDGRLDTLEGKTLLSSSIQIESEISGAFTSVSSSIALDITSVDGRLDVLEGKTLLSSSLQIANEISGAFTSVSSSIAIDLTSVDGRLDILEGKTLLSSSLQIASEISGAFTDTSSSLSFRVTSLENFSSSLDNIYATDTQLSSVSSSLALDLTGVDGRLDTLEGKTLLSSSLQIASEISGAFTDVSSSFNSRIFSLENFSSSLDSTFATDFEVSSLSSSLASDVTGLDNRLDTLEGKTLLSSSLQIASEISGAFTDVSSSLSSRIDVLENFSSSLDSTYASDYEVSIISASLASGLSQVDNRIGSLESKSLISSSLQIQGEISGAFTSTSSSLASSISNVDTRVQNLESKTLLSSSLQIASEISGAFTSTSSSLAYSVDQLDSRLDTLEGKTYLSASAQVQLNEISGNTFNQFDFTFPKDVFILGNLTAQRFSTEYITSSVILESGSTKFGDTLEDIHQFTGSVEVLGGITGSLLGTSSFSLNSDLLDNKDSSVFATTGSNTFLGSQIVSGNIFVSGSLLDTSIVEASIFSSPKTITDNISVYTNTNNLLLSSIDVNSIVEIQSGSNVVVFDPDDYAGRQEFREFTSSVDIFISTPRPFLLSPQVISQSITVPSEYNALALGPVEISDTLIILSGSNLTVFDPDDYAAKSNSQESSTTYSKFVTLTNFLPSDPLSGLRVINSSSANITSSLLWNGTNNKWIQEFKSGSYYKSAGIVTGPTGSSVNDITFPTKYSIVRSQGDGIVYDSNIVDNNNSVQIFIPLSVTGSITSSNVIKALNGFEGNLTGIATSANTASYIEFSNVSNVPSGLVSSSNQIYSSLPNGLVSSSSQVSIESISGNTFPDTTFSFPGNVIISGSLSIQRSNEKITLISSSLSSNINFDVLNQSILYYTQDALNDWTINLRGNSTVTLNSIMSIGSTLTVVLLNTNGNTPYKQIGLTIDGSVVTPKWQGGQVPEGNSDSIDSYSIVLIKIANNTFTVLESLTKFS